MNLFCNHDWTPRTGMDSGSICSKCSKVSNRETDIIKSSGLNDGMLEDKIQNNRKILNLLCNKNKIKYK